ncbi:SHOCT domain-containing protein [Natronolimnohabitans sp. A-GB9]|uniref:SHOCT domain-containing protein n=1 Tax=Natronolimnohabitans sp. A-GB9 TaxID=3069757 RepID=UPI0027B4211E|nr:SHOCT domain-containing protein [Natronolimnohabitans sp. A-GB9]MDQ2052868.1 SHOCT domain-containing protein [Natronolimnohabitans sp. A-GB9]
MTNESDVLRAILLVIALIVLIPLLMMLVAWPMMGLWGGGHMWNDGMWNGTGGTWMWMIGWLPLLLVLLGGSYLLYKAVDRAGGSGEDAALEELRLAYARGDLTDEEYEQRRERLKRDE